jgi:DNA-binding NarL/FixJ family response regulator
MQRARTFPDGAGGNGGDRIRVVVIHPLGIVREALGLLIKTQSDFDVVTAPSASAAVGTIARMRRRSNLVAVIALELTGEHDADWAITTVREQFPWIRIVGFGASAERMSISRALFVGADGFIDHRADPVQFLNGIRQAVAGEMVLVGVPVDWLGPIAGALEQQVKGPSPLTDREHEVLTAASEGLRAREIGDRLGVTERTVTTHLGRIYSKLGVNSRVAAVTTATRSGILRIPTFDYRARRGVP